MMEAEFKESIRKNVLNKRSDLEVTTVHYLFLFKFITK
jgi:hypothetical protein